MEARIERASIDLEDCILDSETLVSLMDPWLDLGCSNGLFDLVDLLDGASIVSSLNLDPGCSNGFVDLEDCLVLGTRSLLS